MTTEEDFNKIYQQIVNKNDEAMEVERKEAKVENRHNRLILVIIFLIDFLIVCWLYKLIKYFSMELVGVLFTISMLIFAEIKHRGGKSKIEYYEKDFKVRVIGMLVKSFNKDLEFDPNERTFSRSI